MDTSKSKDPRPTEHATGTQTPEPRALVFHSADLVDPASRVTRVTRTRRG